MSDAPFRRRRTAGSHRIGRRRKTTAERRRTGVIRDYVFGRERQMCRCCRFRPAESMHELLFRSLGGIPSPTNSVAVCGSGTRGCHGFLQQNQIGYSGDAEDRDGPLVFTVKTEDASRWVRIAVGNSWASPKLPFYVPDGC